MWGFVAREIDEEVGGGTKKSEKAQKENGT